MAWVYRIYDAANFGDWQLAFIQDSFMGYPYTHLLNGVSFIFLIPIVLVIRKESS